MSLDEAPIATRFTIVGIDASGPEEQWLAALGLVVGESITILRKAIFGGPLHVRTGAGGAYAVGRSVAKRIAIAREEAT